MSAKIVWTKIDEAPALATYSLLPIVQAYLKGTGVEVETSDISLAGRIIANFPENLTAGAAHPRQPGHPGRAGAKPARGQHHQAAQHQRLHPAAAGGHQGAAATRATTSPSTPRSPGPTQDKALQIRFAKVLGSAVNPVLREGNADRRAGGLGEEVRPEAPAPDDEALARRRAAGAAWPHMTEKDFYGTETSTTVAKATDGAHRVRRRRRHVAGAEGQAGPARRRGHRHRRDERGRPARVLRRAPSTRPRRDGVLLSLHLKATMMKISDPIMFGHCVSVYFGKALAEARRGAEGDRRQRQQRPGRRAGEARPAAGRQEGGDRGRHPAPATPSGPPWPWSTRARASPTCTCPTTSSSTPPCPTWCATAAGCGTRTTSCRTPSPWSRTAATPPCTRPIIEDCQAARPVRPGHHGQRAPTSA